MTDTDPKSSAAHAAGEAADASVEPRRISEEAECEEAIEQLKGSSAEIERLEAEKSDLTDRLLRLAADMDNLRRRTSAMWRTRANTRSPSSPATCWWWATTCSAPWRRWRRKTAPRKTRPTKALREGVEMTGREMERLLERNGVTKIAAKGERFDPNKHQAMFEVPVPTPPGKPSSR